MCGLVMDEDYKQVRSSPYSQLMMIRRLNIHLTELMIQVQDGAGTVSVPAKTQAFFDAMGTNLKQVSEDMFEQYREYLKVLQMAEIIHKDWQIIKDQGRSVPWPQLYSRMESIKLRLTSINSEWQSRSDNTRISALRQSVDKLLSSTVGAQVLRQIDPIKLEGRMDFLVEKLNNLQNDPSMIELEAQLATKRGELVSTETGITTFKARLHSAKEDRTYYLKKTEDGENEKLHHCRWTHSDHQQQLQAARDDLERLTTTTQSNLEKIYERTGQQLAALQSSRTAVMDAILKLPRHKEDIVNEGRWMDRGRRFLDDTDTKLKAFEQQLKALETQADWITAQTTAEIQAIQKSQETQAGKFETAVQTAMETNKDIGSLLAQQTEASRTLRKMADEGVMEAEEMISKSEGKKKDLNSSIIDLVSRINVRNSIKETLISPYVDEMNSVKDQHHLQLQMQNEAVIHVIQHLQELIRIQSDLIRSDLELTTSISETSKSFSYHWDEALKIRGNDEREFHRLEPITEPPLSIIIASTSKTPHIFDPLVRLLSEAGVDSGVNDALHLLEPEDLKEKEELDALIERYKLGSKLLLRVARKNLKDESERQKAAPNSEAISDLLYQQVLSVYRSLDVFCALSCREYKAMAIMSS